MPVKTEFKVLISFIYLKITSQCEVHIEVVTCIYLNSDLKINIILIHKYACSEQLTYSSIEEE